MRGGSFTVFRGNIDERDTGDCCAGHSTRTVGAHQILDIRIRSINGAQYVLGRSGLYIGKCLGKCLGDGLARPVTVGVSTHTVGHEEYGRNGVHGIFVDRADSTNIGHRIRLDSNVADTG